MKFKFFVPVLIALSIAACGGGGSGTPVIPPPNQNNLQIDAANAKPAVRVAYGSVIDTGASSDVIGGPIVGTPGGLSKPASQKTVSGALDRIMRKDPLGPLVEPCFDGVGTQTTTGELASPFTISTGDTINTDYADCLTEFGETLNGRTEMTVVIFSGDIFSGQFLLDVNMVLVDYSVMFEGETVTLAGDTRVSIDTTGMPMIMLTTNGTSLSATNGVDTQVMTNFASSASVDTSVFPEPYTQTSSATVNSSELTGIISYRTPTPFQGVGAEYPFAGQLRIDGAGNTYILVTALDSINVLIEADTTGDGQIDTTENTTWDDIATRPPGL